MDQVAKFLEVAASWFGVPLVITIMAVALFFTVRLRFVQFVRFREALRETIASRQTGTSGAISPLQAFMTALAATIGTGNIAGVATAIVSGGPGALFWIWCYGLLAMSTKFAEASLGMHFRVAHGEEVLAGPMYYLRDGLKSPALAWIFAFLAGLGVILTTPMSQTNSVAIVLKSEFNLQPWILGIVLAVLTWLVIVRGIKSIGRAAEKLVANQSGTVSGRWYDRDRHAHFRFAGSVGDGVSRCILTPCGSGRSGGFYDDDCD